MVGECLAALMTLRVDGEAFALADLSVSAVDPAYVQTHKIALGLLLTFVPAVPLLIFGSLYHKRAQLRTEEGQMGLDISWKAKFFYFYGKLAPPARWLARSRALIASALCPLFDLVQDRTTQSATSGSLWCSQRAQLWLCFRRTARLRWKSASYSG